MLTEFSRRTSDEVIVSVLVATKSNRICLERLVTLAFDEGLPSTEIVVVDGGSEDGTIEWLSKRVGHRGQPTLVAVSELDRSIAEAWNRGLRLARGKWVVFLGADDFVIDHLSWQTVMSCLCNLSPECGIAAFPVRVITSGGATVSDVFPRIGDQRTQFPAANSIPHQGAFHRRSLWTTLGPFDESFAIAADYEFLLRVHAAGIDMRVCDGPPPVAMTFGGASKRSPLANLREFRRAQRMHGIAVPLLQRCREWCFAALRHVVAATCGEPFARRWADRARRLRGLPPVWEVP